MDKHEFHSIKQFSANAMRSTLKPRNGEQAGARIIVLVLVVFLLGIGTGAYWIHRNASSGASGTDSQQSVALPDNIKSILKNLDSPVEIRFYSLLDPASVGDATRAFARRVEQLLSEYQSEAGGKINVAQINSMSAANADTASADGIRPFNMDKGDACYLGTPFPGMDKRKRFHGLTLIGNKPSSLILPEPLCV